MPWQEGRFIPKQDPLIVRCEYCGSPLHAMTYLNEEGHRRRPVIFCDWCDCLSDMTTTKQEPTQSE